MRASLHLNKSNNNNLRQRRRGMNGRTFSQNSRKREKSHRHMGLKQAAETCPWKVFKCKHDFDRPHVLFARLYMALRQAVRLTAPTLICPWKVFKCRHLQQARLLASTMSCSLCSSFQGATASGRLDSFHICPWKVFKCRLAQLSAPTGSLCLSLQ